VRKRKIVRIGTPKPTSLSYEDRAHLRDNATTTGKCRLSTTILHYPLHGRLARGATCRIPITHVGK